MELIVQVPDEYFTNPKQLMLLEAVYEALAEQEGRKYQIEVTFFVAANDEEDALSELRYALDHSAFKIIHSYDICDEAVTRV